MTDNEDIPFNRDFPLKPGVVNEPPRGAAGALQQSEPVHLHRHGRYIVGRARLRSSIPAGRRGACGALLDAVRGETVTHILVTHSHRDHLPNTARIKAATGAPAMPSRIAPRGRASRAKRGPESGADRDFRPDIEVKNSDPLKVRAGARSGGDAGPHRQPSGVRLAGTKNQLRRRSRHRLVDLDRRAARWFDDRLHGLAGTPGAARGDLSFSATDPRYQKGRATCASWPGTAGA